MAITYLSDIEVQPFTSGPSPFVVLLLKNRNVNMSITENGEPNQKEFDELCKSPGVCLSKEEEVELWTHIEEVVRESKR